MGNEFVGDGSHGFYVAAGEMEMALGLVRSVARQASDDWWNSRADETVRAWIEGWGRGDDLLRRLTHDLGEAKLQELIARAVAAAAGRWTPEEIASYVYPALQGDMDASTGMELVTIKPVLLQVQEVLAGRWTAPPHLSYPHHWRPALPGFPW